MFKQFTVLAAIFSATTVFAAGVDTLATVSEHDNAVMISTSKDSWTMVALNTDKGMVKVREFHEMGDSGVQQIDYVVNCSEQSLALAGFAVLTSTGRLPAKASEPSFNQLSFYKPAISHDRNIANNACENRVALNGSIKSE